MAKENKSAASGKQTAKKRTAGTSKKTIVAQAKGKKTVQGRNADRAAENRGQRQNALRIKNAEQEQIKTSRCPVFKKCGACLMIDTP